MDPSRVQVRLALSDGELQCPRKHGVIGKGRCIEWQHEFRCTCAVAAATECAIGPVVAPPPEHARAEVLARLAAALRAEPERVFSHAELSSVAGPRHFITTEITDALVAAWVADRVEGGYRAAVRAPAPAAPPKVDRLALVRAAAERAAARRTAAAPTAATSTATTPASEARPVAATTTATTTATAAPGESQRCTHTDGRIRCKRRTRRASGLCEYHERPVPVRGQPGRAWRAAHPEQATAAPAPELAVEPPAPELAVEPPAPASAPEREEPAATEPPTPEPAAATATPPAPPAEEVHMETGSSRQRVYDVLKGNASRQYNVAELMAIAHARKPTVHEAVSQGVKKGFLERVEPGVYRWVRAAAPKEDSDEVAPVYPAPPPPGPAPTARPEVPDLVPPPADALARLRWLGEGLLAHFVTPEEFIERALAALGLRR